MANPRDYLYTKDHEWIQMKDKVARIGITDYAQNELGDVVFVELPEEETIVEEGEGFAVVESVKAVSDVYAPLSGKVVGINEALEDSPELVNESPFDEGWIVELEITDESQLKDLMTADEYDAFLEEV